MSRIRSIKPEFFTDEDIGKLEPVERLAFQGLWCHADREGRLEDKAQQLQVQILPYDKGVDFSTILETLAHHGFIIRYSINNKKYISITNFLKHQRPNTKELPSVIPKPLIIQVSTKETHSGISPVEIQNVGKGRGKERKGEGKEGDSLVNKCVDFWVKFGDQLPQPRLNEDGTLQSVAIVNDIKKRLKIPGWKDLYKEAVVHANKCPHARGDNGRGWKASLSWMVGSPRSVDKALDWVADQPKKLLPASAPTPIDKDAESWDRFRTGWEVMSPEQQKALERKAEIWVRENKKLKSGDIGFKGMVNATIKEIWEETRV